jgi:hypothetical protein
LFFTAGPAWAQPRDAGDRIEVVVRGTVKMGVMAIGAEATGVTITSNGVTWELELSPRQLDAARKLDGRKALVKGALEFREGVETGRRAIVKVRSIASG